MKNMSWRGMDGMSSQHNNARVIRDEIFEVSSHQKTSGKPLASDMGMNAIGDFNRPHM